MDVMSEIIEAFEENKNIFLILITLFIIGLTIGWIFADDIAPYFLPILQEALNDTSSLEAFSILQHNLTSAALTFIFSIFFAIYPLFASLLNGFAIGFLGGYTVKTPASLIVFLALIIPHGIIEIPAILCECASGILFFLFILKTFFNILEKFTLREAYENNKMTIKHCVILFLISVVLLIIAAFIESYITPFLGNLISLMLYGKPIF